MAPAATRVAVSRRGAPAAAIIAKAVFRLIGEIGVAGTKLVLDIGIVLGALIGVLDQERDRRAGGHLHPGVGMRHHAGENLDRIRLLALGGEARLPGTAAVEIVLDFGLGQRQQRRAAVDHAADRNPVAFAEGRDPKQVAESVEGHIWRSGRRAKSMLNCRNARAPGGQIRVLYEPRGSIAGRGHDGDGGP